MMQRNDHVMYLAMCLWGFDGKCLCVGGGGVENKGL